MLEFQIEAPLFIRITFLGQFLNRLSSMGRWGKRVDSTEGAGNVARSF